MLWSDFPDEILLAIAEHVEFEYDLNALVQISRRLYHCLNGFLCRKSQQLGGAGLVTVANTGCEGSVREFLDQGANVNATDLDDDNDRTILAFATQMGHLSIVQLLLGTEGVDVNVHDEGRTPLSFAAKATMQWSSCFFRTPVSSQTPKPRMGVLHYTVQ
ncbi:hypothetical protein AWENTII_006269 [Aspergillus wentii]